MNSVVQHRANIGTFYAKSVERKVKYRKVLSANLLLPFFILFTNGLKYIHLSLFVFMFLDERYHYPLILENSLNNINNVPTHSVNLISDVCPNVTQNDTKSSKNSAFYQTLLFIMTLIKRMLLLLSGNVHTNPGPCFSALTDNVSIIHWNICSLRNKMEFVEIESKKHDILTISETWLDNNDDSNNLSLPGFHPIVRKDRDGHGGVGIYVRSNMVMKERPDLDVPGLESVWIETKINQNVLLVGTIYMPPNTPVAYWELVRESVDNVFNTPHRFIILGDLNTCFLNNPSPHLVNIIQQYNLHQLVNDYTRITTETKRCIDLVLTSSTDYIGEVSVLPSVCSDHMLPCVKLKLRKNDK